MLAIFDWDTARAPSGLESHRSLSRHHAGLKTEAERRHSEELCSELIESARKTHQGHALRTRHLGSGNGFVFEGGPYCCYASKDGVHALFAGEVSQWPGFDAVSESHNAFVRDDNTQGWNGSDWLLQFYSNMDLVFDSDVILNCLSQVEGRFAFVVYDERRRRVTAGRDRDGSEKMYWGVTEEGQLLFGSSEEDLCQCEPSAVCFPAGTLYVSQGDTVAESPGEMGWVIEGQRWPGRLSSFVKGAKTWRNVKEIPRVTSRGILSGAVYKVDSERDLAQCGGV